MSIENKQTYAKIYEITCSSETNLEEYRRFIDALINTVNNDVIYGILSLIRKNYYTTYLVLLSDNIDRLSEEVYSLNKIIDMFKQYITVRDRTSTKIKNYLLIPLITARFRKNSTHDTIMLNYVLTRTYKKYLYRNLRYDEYQLLNDLILSNKKYITLGESLNLIPNIEVILAIDHLYRHTMIVGSSGSGKTTTAKKIIKTLIEKKFNGSIIVMDWHREYYTLNLHNIDLSYYTPGKPTDTNLGVPPINCNVDLDATIQVIETVLQLTPPQTYLLMKTVEKICRNKNIATFNDILKEIDNYKKESTVKSEQEAIQALYRKLYTIVQGQGLFLFNSNNNFKDTLEKNSGKIMIVDLSTIVNIKLRLIYALILMKTIFEYKSLYIVNKPIIIVLEEAHNYLHKNNLLNSIISESRKYDLGFIIIEQSISNLTNDIIANTFNKIIHTTVSPVDLEKLRHLLSQDYVKILPFLEVGEAVFMGGIFREPLIIKIT